MKAEMIKGDPVMEKLNYYIAPVPQGADPVLELLSPENTREVQSFHRGMDGYAVTPLRELKNQAAKLGVRGFFVKDESSRFGLNAFKALGGSYAMAKELCRRLDIPVDENTYSVLRSKEIRERLGDMTFVTATDGNHGRGIAWMARELGQKAVVYMPEGTVAERLQNIRALGAEAEILPMNYDACVRHASAMAEKYGWILVQDTAWEGYEEIPASIMRGYSTMAAEIRDQLPEGVIPTHLFLQAGVGSMAGAVAGYFSALWQEKRPKIIIVEPDKADCHYRTAKANDGKLHIVTGAMDSLMAGLCCGEPCTLSWEILKHADAFVSCGDGYTIRGMRLLGKPLGDDPKVVSGESGAVTSGVAAAILTEPELRPLGHALGMDERSIVLTISTEGDTDKEHYRSVMGEAVQ